MATTAPEASPAGGKTAPGPRGRWLTGCLGSVYREPLAFYTRCWRDYGDVVRIRAIPGIYFFMVSHPDAVEHLLQKRHKNYRKPDNFNRSLGSLAGNGLIVSEGDFWLRQRRLMQPAFHRQSLAALAPKMVEAAEACLREWDQTPAGQPVDALDSMMRLSLRVAGTTLFSTDLSGEASELGPAFRVAFEHVSRLMQLGHVPEWVPTPHNRRYFRARRLIDRVVLGMIAARRRDPDPPHDLLSLLLAAQEEGTGQGMTDEQLRNEALTLLVAGHDTVGAALGWAWYLLGQNPHVQQSLHDEAAGVLGGRSPTADDLLRLPLARAVFDETIRLYPPALGQPREAIEDDEIFGFTVPRKSVAMVCQWVTHRRPDLWPEPEAFRPERFLGESDRPKFAYYPFGGGPRICIGQTFALMEGPLVLATLAQRHRVELVPGQNIEPDTTLTLRPRPGVRVTLSRWA